MRTRPTTLPAVCQHRPVSPRRWFSVVAALISVLIAVLIGGFVFSRTHESDGANRLERQGLLAVLPATCRMQTAVDQGLASQAFNIFWDDVHTDAHLLAARLDRKDRAQGARFRESKGFIERDLATLSTVGLKQHVPAFLVQVRAGMKTLALPGSDAPCP